MAQQHDQTLNTKPLKANENADKSKYLGKTIEHIDVTRTPQIVQVVEAMGARRVYSSHSRWVAFEPGTRGDLDSFIADADACGWGAGQAQMVSFHIMGSARMGGSPIDSVCDPTGQVWSTPGLYVLDGSALPTASGVNPMVTIEALAQTIDAKDQVTHDHIRRVQENSARLAHALGVRDERSVAGPAASAGPAWHDRDGGRPEPREPGSTWVRGLPGPGTG